MTRRPTLPRTTPRAALAAAGVLLAASALAGCSSSDSEPGDEAPAGGSTEVPSLDQAAEVYPEVPGAPELTPPGTELAFGDEAEVAWQPREGTVGALKMKVIGVEERSLDEFSAFEMNRAVSQSRPYFVTVRAENVGETELGGVGIPLYLLDSRDTLVERSVFGSEFTPCPSEELPRRFGEGDVTKTCLVFLAPRGSEAEAVSFRPTEEFDPITWTGEITPPAQPEDRRRGGQQDGGRGGQQGGQQGAQQGRQGGGGGGDGR
ncbi:hypothetical protein [Nocardioides sp. CFH 31398]|uniref:hypothetical protein n=1 Tax=Nocardioides sp. CFH 31398 TaxID=2919579 RepID=UPI001F05CF5B|nr:hypothetical protein [Nocardioides sp. CFH 31398]MCH1868465.1 hypothetical protein [Nocardioides sp. CFH 31398]